MVEEGFLIFASSSYSTKGYVSLLNEMADYIKTFCLLLNVKTPQYTTPWH